ncbi:MAG: hypothetical protein ACKKMP_01425 [Candidatus Nealsonbacteria bacterium]
MVLENKSGQFGRQMWGESSGSSRKYGLPVRLKKPETRPDIKKPGVDKGVWGSKGHLTRSELRQRLRSQSLFKHGLKEKERVELEKEIFPHQKYGTHITRQKLIKVIKDLQKEQYRNPKEKWRIEKKIKTLKNALGEK